MKFLLELSAMSDQLAMNTINGKNSSATNSRLTNTQKSVLLSIYAAPTPETAYDTTTGSENVTQARQQLRSLGLINVDDNNSRAGVTDTGQETLVNNNLIDDTGQLTEEGQQLLDQENKIKDDFENATEAVTFSVLKTLI